MREILQFEAAQIGPDRDAVLKGQGIPAGAEPGERTRLLLDRAMGLLASCCRPQGIVAEIPPAEFDEVYRGEGANEPHTPLDKIAGRAERLALFAITLGEEVSEKISRLFDANDFALGCMLDSAASEGAEAAAGLAERRFLDRLRKEGSASDSTAVLAYSPGYCGWHVSGQKKLFAYLRPERIGIRLGESYLMQPLKSISGVLVAGDREIHNFEDSYPFCEQCRTQRCRHRAGSAAGA